jgi:hypothetical protein
MEDGNLDLVMFLHAMYVLSTSDANTAVRFASLNDCKGNNEVIAQWFNDFCKPDIVSVVDNYVEALMRACNTGDLSMVEWITTYFGVPFDSVHFTRTVALQTAQVKGHHNVTQWIRKWYM